MSARVDSLWNDERAAMRLVRTGLRPLSWLFHAIAVLRVRLYAAGWLRSRRVGVPVISVGNLRVGGSGKTPMVMHLVELFVKCGLRPVVVSRGYAARRAGPAIVATEVPPSRSGRQGVGSLRVVDAALACRQAGGAGMGDEALLVALRTGVPVVTDPDRVAGALTAVRVLDADVVVLDDGFQHLRLARDFDLVLVSALDRRAACLPSGPMREPWTALGRADFVVWSDAGSSAIADGNDNVASVCVIPTALVDSVAAVEGLPPTWLAGKKVDVVAGIARPQRFADAIEEVGGEIRSERYYPDHHAYEESDVARIMTAAAGADAVVVTEKDLVKLAPAWSSEVPLLGLRIDVEIDGEQALVDALRACHARLDALGRESHHPDSTPLPGKEDSRET